METDGTARRAQTTLAARGGGPAVENVTQPDRNGGPVILVNAGEEVGAGGNATAGTSGRRGGVDPRVSEQNERTSPPTGVSSGQLPELDGSRAGGARVKEQPPLPTSPRDGVQLHDAASEAQWRIAGYEVDGIPADRHAVLDALNGTRGSARDELVQHAVEIVERMLNDHERESDVRRRVAEEPFDRPCVRRDCLLVVARAHARSSEPSGRDGTDGYDTPPRRVGANEPRHHMLDLDLSYLPDDLLLGTSSFSTSDWCGSFYPPDARARDFLAHYATRLRTVEIDATFYASPPPGTAAAWAAKTPEDFIVAAKVPRSITHDGYLENVGDELRTFVDVMRRLGVRLGPLLFQFPYVSRRSDAEEHGTGADFRARLERFLPLLPDDVRFAVEVRNAAWIRRPLVDLLARHGVALALTVYRGMPEPARVLERIDPFVTDFAYLRFLGDHREMDRRVEAAMQAGTRRSEWGELIVDRTDEMARVIPVIERALGRGMQVFTYFNNHYAGFAPGSIASFARLWRARAIERA